MINSSAEGLGRLNIFLKHGVANIAAAMAASTIVAPIMSIIDQAVMEAAFARSTVIASIKARSKAFILRPHQFLTGRPHAIMLLLYGGTYLTANAVDSLSAHAQGLSATASTSSISKLCAVTSVNLGLSLYKDSAYVKLLATPAKSLRRLPIASYVPFITRDAITLFATFNVPLEVAPRLPVGIEAHISRLTLAQISCPALSQVIATPLHLLGADLCYRRESLPVHQRIKGVWQAWWPASLARAFRIIPAYGLGSVVNARTRDALLSDATDKS